jgi:hypothetical protein
MAYLNLYKIFKGTTPGDKTGTPARTAAQGINDNMDAISNALESIDNAAEKSTNKATNLAAPNHTNYPTTQAAADGDAAAEANAKNYADGLMGAYQPTSEKGQASGYAPLDANAKVPAVNLPAFVDEIVEGTYINATTFNDTGGNPVTPGAAKIYQDTSTGGPDSGKQYRWSGSQFSEIISSPGTTDAIPEGASNIYFTGARVLTVLLAGLTTGVNAAITAGDTILAAFGKLQAQINSLTTALGLKLDKGNYTGTAEDLKTLIDTKETPLGAQAKADTAETRAKAYADSITGSSGAATRLESYNTGYISGLNYKPSASWIKEGIPANDTRELSLAAADPSLDRYDLFIVDLAAGQVAILTGSPAANPVAPGYDPATQLPGPLVRITAGATQPDGVITTDIYQENAEWTVPASAAVDPASTAQVYSGSLSLETTDLSNSTVIEFAAPAPLDIASASQLSYRIKNKTGGGHSILIQGQRSNGRLSSFYLDAPATAGYNANDTTTWQFISLGIPSSNLVNITKVYLVSNVDGLAFYLDAMVITGGDAAPVSGNFASLDYVNDKDAETLAAAKAYADGLTSTGGGSIQNRYNTITEMLADQASQVDKALQYVADASEDATVNSGFAYYEYLGTTAGDLTDYKKLSEEESLDITAGIPKEHEIIGEKITASISGAYNLDYNAASQWDLTLIGAATLQDLNLPTGTGTKVISLYITGDFSLALPTYWDPLPGNDEYAGTLTNRLMVEIRNGNPGSEKATYLLENLSS